MRLRSSDGLYTAPQIRALAGNSLGETAYAVAAAKRLGRPLRLGRSTAAALKPSPDDDRAWNLYYRRLLADAGAPVQAPSRGQVLSVWRSRAPAAPAVEESARLAVLVDAGTPVGVRANGLPGQARALVAKAIAGTRREPSATVQLQRLKLARFLGRSPDRFAEEAVRSTAERQASGEDKAVELASLVELRTRLGTLVPAALRGRAAAAAVGVGTPAAAYAATEAFTVARQSLSPLNPLAARLARAARADGAIAERAVFPGLPKAVWLVARLRKQVGAQALPDPVLARVSRQIPQVAQRGREDPDAAAYLLGAAKLGGLSYEQTSLAPVRPPATLVRSAEDADAWAQRAPVAAALGLRVPSVRVQPFALSGEGELGAAGALIAAAGETRTRVSRSGAWASEFRRRAAARRYRTVRAATEVSAALVRLGDTRAAQRIVKRDVSLGCRGFGALVADRGGDCDLESTYQVLEMRKRVPAADTLAERITASR